MQSSVLPYSYRKLAFLCLLLIFAIGTQALAQTKIRYNQVKVDYDGDITMSDDLNDITAISSGGYFRYQDKNQEIYIRSKSDGSLIKEYFVKGKKQAYEPEGRTFLSQILPKLIRESGLGAEQRVAKLYDQNGLTGVLEEIKLIESSYVSRIYYDKLLEKYKLTESELVKVAQSLENELDSDYEQSRLLREHSQLFLANSKTTDAFLSSTKGISSDYEKSRVLRHLIDETRLNNEQIAKVLSSTDDIQSDYELGRVLRKISDKYQLSANELEETLKASESIQSDYEFNRVLLNLLEDQNFESQQLEKLTVSAENLKSDYERSRFLRAILNKKGMDETSLKLILKASKELKSNYEKAKVISSVMKSINELDPCYKELLDAIQKVTSNYEKSKLLSQVINFELSSPQIDALLTAIEGVSQDYEKSKLLQKLGPKLPASDTKLVEAYRRVAKTIGSDYEYGKVMRAID